MTTRREPTSVGITFHPFVDGDGVMHHRPQSYFTYDDGSTGPLPDGKTYFDYLPEDRKQAIWNVIKEMLVRRALERVRASDGQPAAEAAPTPPALSTAAQEIIERFQDVPQGERSRLLALLRSSATPRRGRRPKRPPTGE